MLSMHVLLKYTRSNESSTPAAYPVRSLNYPSSLAISAAKLSPSDVSGEQQLESCSEISCFLG